MAIVVFLLFTNHSLPHFAKKKPLKEKKSFFSRRFVRFLRIFESEKL